TGTCDPDCPGGEVKLLKGSDRDGHRFSEAYCGHCHQILGRSDSIESLKARVDVLAAHLDQLTLEGKTLEYVISFEQADQSLEEQIESGGILSARSLEDSITGAAEKSLEEIFGESGQ